MLLPLLPTFFVFAFVLHLVGAADLFAYLRIGTGFTSVATAISLIPLRRDERVENALLVPIYTLSLASTLGFLFLQYSNIIVRLRDRYVFCTFLLSVHFVAVLSQQSNTTLEGIIDLGPVILPLVAAAFSLVFRRREPTTPTTPSRETNDVRNAEEGQGIMPDEADIGLSPMEFLALG
ncbi:hypothetical protein F4777DRAFT_572716 [Nemania sp. FL0916]|nr:hypothetical protein F4777DRAFT_572716 [Nemania sp. FL0916]